MVNQDEIHRMAQSEDVEERREAVNLLRSNFTNFPDKKQAYDILHQLLNDKNRLVRYAAINSLCVVFPQVIHKKKIWGILQSFTQDKDRLVRKSGVDLLCTVFPEIPKKKQAWDSLIKLTLDEDSFVRRKAVQSLCRVFLHISDKKQTYEDLHQLICNGDRFVQVGVINIFRDNFNLVYDKKKAWESLVQLTHNGDRFVEKNAAESLGAAFPFITDKKKAWEDLHRLTQDENKFVRKGAVKSLVVAFPFITNKKKAWEDIHRLTQDNTNFIRLAASSALCTNFSLIPNKKQAWEDLIRLVQDKDLDIRLDKAESNDPNKENTYQQTQDEYIIRRLPFAQALGAAFPYVPDRKNAYKDLHNLSQNEDVTVRLIATGALGYAFLYVHDKNQAWEVIHYLTQDDGKFVRGRAASILGSIFSLISAKEQSWLDLIHLTKDEDSDVRVSANYSLGKISIFKATLAESKEDYGKEVENAIRFFEKSADEVTFFKPAKFCLPFYRSYYTITFNKQDAESEVQKYIAEAKDAVEGSESKEKLLETVENLKNALREAQNQKIQEIDLNTMKCDLEVYKRYCERAVDLLNETEEKAPGATKLIRMGLPIIDQKIKEIITEIRENAKTLCKQTKDTPLEDLGKEVIRVSQTFPQIRDSIGLEKGFINLWTALSSICAKMPEEERGEACELLKKAGDEPYIEDKLPLINMVLSKISSQISAAKNIETVEKKLDEILIFLKPGIRQELIITVGVEFGGTGAQHVITVPLQEISYPDLKKDLEKVKGRNFLKLSSLPAKLAEKVKSYIIQNKKEEL